MSKWDELEQLARKATPGDWWIDSHGHTMVSFDDCETHTIFHARELVKPAARHPETGNLSHWPNDWDASYIATANPKAVLSLIEHNRELLEACKMHIDALRGQVRDGSPPDQDAIYRAQTKMIEAIRKSKGEEE